jgi:aspartate/methionine/tyrosine aminotransferase
MEVMARIRRGIAELPSSKIREVANLGIGRQDIIPLWFGESDLPTPDFIVAAAKRALDGGHTFYAANRGIPPLREALAKYLTNLHGVSVTADRVTVTASGMAAITVVTQALVDPGDNVVLTSPLWPNCRESVHIMGGETRVVELEMAEHGWTLDLDRVFDRVDARTRALFINSPSNPTGWMMPHDQQREILGYCRDRGIWIVADEVYNRIVYDGRHAPSFISLAEPDDAVIAINSFSKSWCMTGWRLGWLVGPARLGPVFEKLIEFNFSCAVAFVQHAAIAAIEQGEPFIAESVTRYRHARDMVHERLSNLDRVRIALPKAAFYAFFAIDGMADSTAFAKGLVETHGVGLAPGTAFGPGGEGHLRLCFASAPATLSQALDRLEDALGR